MGALCLASLAYRRGGRGRLVGATPHPRSRESFFGGEKSREVGACAGRGLGGSGRGLQDSISQQRIAGPPARGPAAPGSAFPLPPRAPWALAWGSYRGGGRDPLTSAGLVPGPAQRGHVPRPPAARRGHRVSAPSPACPLPGHPGHALSHPWVPLGMACFHPGYPLDMPCVHPTGPLPTLGYS